MVPGNVSTHPLAGMNNTISVRLVRLWVYNPRNGVLMRYGFEEPGCTGHSPCSRHHSYVGPGNYLSKDMKGFAAFWPEAKYGKMRIEGRDPVNA
jgi:hypothetical protein